MFSMDLSIHSCGDREKATVLAPSSIYSLIPSHNSYRKKGLLLEESLVLAGFLSEICELRASCI